MSFGTIQILLGHPVFFKNSIFSHVICFMPNVSHSRENEGMSCITLLQAIRHLVMRFLGRIIHKSLAIKTNLSNILLEAHFGLDCCMTQLT